MIEQQLKSKQGAPQGGQQQAMPSGGGGGGAVNGGQPGQQPASAGVVGAQMQAAAATQPDYSAQWAEYYRSIGKIDEAEAIENQIKTTKVSSVIGGVEKNVLRIIG